MARKKTPALTGMEDVDPDPPPAIVQEKVDEYVKVLRTRQRNQEKENALRSEVIALMKEHGVDSVELDEERKLVLANKGDALRIKKIIEPAEAVEE